MAVAVRVLSIHHTLYSRIYTRKRLGTLIDSCKAKQTSTSLFKHPVLFGKASNEVSLGETDSVFESFGRQSAHYIQDGVRVRLLAYILIPPMVDHCCISKFIHIAVYHRHRIVGTKMNLECFAIPLQ